MSEEIPWAFTEWGEDSRRERKRKRMLHETREKQLYSQEIDARLIGFVWNAPPILTDALVVQDLTNVSWLDDIAIEHRGIVPICNLRFLDLGVGARGGELVMMEERHEEPVDLTWVWCKIFEPGLERLAQALRDGRAEPSVLFDEDGLRVDPLFEELGQLGGVALIDFAADKLGMTPSDALREAARNPKPIEMTTKYRS